MKIPVTAAVRVLRQHKVDFEPFLYRYEPQGGTAASAAHLGVDEHQVVKTLIFEDERRQPLVVLMHGDRQVSAKELARLLGVKAISPCKPEVAQKHSGYMVGGTSPFGTKKKMPVYVERGILELEKIYINGGKRGFLVAIAPAVLADVLSAQPVSAAT
ncbi:Cys-tRNA(Pro) deacylase [Acanthopleuribacter pedis]|uniref:Cys-tRNA(Pro)/Cys-tRNA(Cys) deacylase n=1 Tax=Acanthopleuribacter pedis TaxID=442870 RepID=A0A8J7U7F4_9BACT|nr:Cys-tRNA(Pro) deacylase [Acanthopleuribacter pedis]MBO1321351.1 Cys-tRNA(Pro) deacylase [Acanthopleuribacter pedis]